MLRILKVGRSAIAALFAVSLMFIVMLIAAVLALPALATGSASEPPDDAARNKPAAASPVTQTGPSQAIGAQAPHGEPAPAGPEVNAAVSQSVCVLKLVNLLMPAEIEGLRRLTEGQVEFTQISDLRLLVLRGRLRHLGTALDSLQKMVHLRTDPLAEVTIENSDTVVESHRFTRIEPRRGVKLIEEVLPGNKLKVELREKAKSVVIEGSSSAVREAMELLRYADGTRPHFMVRKAFDVQLERPGSRSEDRLPTGEGPRER